MGGVIFFLISTHLIHEHIHCRLNVVWKLIIGGIEVHDLLF